MTNQEIKNKIEDLENRIFLIHMIDRWTPKTRETLDRLEKELRELKEKEED